MPRQNAEIGRRIREERKRQGLTLKELGQLVGLSAAYLSQMENGHVNINITNLELIGQGLGVPLITFFINGNDSDVSLVRRSDRRWFGLGGHATESLLIKRRGNLEIFMIRLPPNADSAQDSSHTGEEFCYIVSGSVRVVLDNKDTFDLNEGDILYYHSDIPHRWHNISDEEAEILVVNTPATY